MKRFLYFSLVALSFVACQNSGEEQVVADASLTEAMTPPPMAYFGSQITDEGALDASLIPEKLAAADSLRVKVVGTVDKVCQAKGCWMTMNVGQAEPMHVTFKDYSFFVPKNIDGKEAIIEGYVHRETLTVDQLKHYAEDEGKSQEEIDAITEDKVTLSFVADGVIVKDYVVETGAAAEGETPADEEGTETSDGHNHDHEGHDHHDHGVSH